MATLAELISSVYTVTSRDDLVEETKLAVKAATLKAHGTDFYPKDLYETGIAWATPAYLQSLDYRLLIPRWRAFKFLRKYNNGEAGGFFQLLTPDQILDSYGIQKQDVCYVAGTMLEIRSSTQDTNALLGCFLHPDTNETTYTSWIAIEQPYAIIFEASRLIFKMVGQLDMAASLNNEVAEQYQELRNNNVFGAPL